MVIEIDDFKKWFLAAKRGDKFIYHRGNLAHDREEKTIDGTRTLLDKLATYIIDTCCEWDVSFDKKTKLTSSEIKMKNTISLTQKAIERWQDEKGRKFINCEYIATKI